MRKPHIGYGLADRGVDLRARTWELQGRSILSALGFIAFRAGENLAEAIRLEVERPTFMLGGKDLAYYTPLQALHRGRHSATFARRMATLGWGCLTDRCVELPAARSFLRASGPGRLLEIGNVLGYWYDLPDRTIVDRYERGPGIVNEDIVDYRPSALFDQIVSVSTLEHVGFDEPVRDPGRFGEALRALDRLGTPSARVFLTVPIGYNPSVDAAIRAGEFQGYRTTALVGDASGRRGWHEVPVAHALEAREGLLFATRG